MIRLLLIFLLLLPVAIFSQVNPNDTIRVDYRPKDSISTVVENSDVDVLADIEESNAPAKLQRFSPTKAGLYSAVLPGLGQFYNKKYWKIPVAWGALGAGIGLTLWFDKDYRRYRSAFISELNGEQHEFSDRPYIDEVALGNFQDIRKRQRDYAIAITSLVYLLNIIDAVVDAHLYEGRNDPDLAIAPTVVFPDYGIRTATPGISLSFKF